jgi:3-deoxy-D-manno-octulosonate 8-phosphate phosphatase (KDO 8-P phosphatase)
MTQLDPTRCRRIEWLLSDVDGVMTDGGVILTDSGEQLVRFHIRDGLGVRLWRQTGRRFGILTGRNVDAVRRRGEQLHADAIYQGEDDKLATFERFLAAHTIAAEHVCYVGDDLLDLPVLRRAGVAMTVAGAPDEVQRQAAYVTRVGGGHGALREVVEVLLKTIGEWESLLADFNQ